MKETPSSKSGPPARAVDAMWAFILYLWEPTPQKLSLTLWKPIDQGNIHDPYSANLIVSCSMR